MAKNQASKNKDKDKPADASTETEAKSGASMVPPIVKTMEQPKGKKIKVIAKANSSLHDGTELEMGKEAFVSENEYKRCCDSGRAAVLFENH